MRRDANKTPTANPGGERGMFRAGTGNRTATPGTSRPRTAAQSAVGPGRVAHSRTRGQGMGRGIGIGAAAATAAMTVKSVYDQQQSENAKYGAYQRGKNDGRQTTSTGAKAPKSTYEAPVTKALMADGAKPVMKPK